MIDEQVHRRSLELIRTRRDAVVDQIVNGQCQRASLEETGAAYMKAVSELQGLIFSENSMQQAWKEVYQIKEVPAPETPQDDPKARRSAY